MARAIQQAEKKRYTLVTFQHGAAAVPVFERYTNWGQSPGGGFVSVPTMEVKIPANSGSLEDQEGHIDLPLDSFTANFEGGLVHSPTFVQVVEITRSTIAGAAGSELGMFTGRVVKTRENPGGKPNLMRFLLKSRKSRLRISLGVPCNHHCVFTLFGRGCQLAKIVRAVTVDNIDGRVATINTTSFTTPTSPGGNVDFYWDRGYLEKDGLRIPIQSWSLTDPTQCYLRRRPPATWLGASVSAVPGCHKTIEDCRDVWDNEINFGGIGYAIPPYNPLFEDPS